MLQFFSATRITIARAASIGAVLLIAVAACESDGEPRSDSNTSPRTATPASGDTHEGLLYARVTLEDGEIYEGRMRFGDHEEALWSHYFNGTKAVNPWFVDTPLEQIPEQRDSLVLFGIATIRWMRESELSRPFMARLGDITRIEPRGRDLFVTLKSGTTVHLDRYGADDLADGLRIWDATKGMVDIDEWEVRRIDLLATPLTDSSPGAPAPLYGTVHTPQGDFTGFIQWDREQSLAHDSLHGFSIEGEMHVPFGTIRSIARQSLDSAAVLMHDGRRVVLSDTRAVGRQNRGVYVDDSRYGRVLVSWNAFESIDFSAGGNGLSYAEFLPGRPLSGSVTTRSGRRLSGRLVFDLDESESTETLDAPSQGIDYTIPFGRIASIVLGEAEMAGGRVTVALYTGEQLLLERAGDLADSNGGLLVFAEGGQSREYVPWADVAKIEFDRMQ